MEKMQFDVAMSSHDMLKQGITEPITIRVAVWASSYADGQCMAAQFASALQAIRKSKLDMPTATYPVI